MFCTNAVWKKPAVSGKVIDSDAVYESLIRPAIIDAELEPLRADEEMTGIYQRTHFMRVCHCRPHNTANANVFYELGIQHAIRSTATILLFAMDTGPLPFDVASPRNISYEIDADGKPGNIAATTTVLSKRLCAARRGI